MTLEEAQDFLIRHFEEGADCPCCGQFVKLYKRRLYSSMAYALILIDRYFRHPDAEMWLHVPSYLDAVLPPSVAVANRGGDWAKLQHWDLIEPKPVVRDDGSSRAGFWRMTRTGRLFVMGLVSVPRHLYFFNQRVVDFLSADEERTSIQQALGDQFDYVELMGHDSHHDRY